MPLPRPTQGRKCLSAWLLVWFPAGVRGLHGSVVTAARRGLSLPTPPRPAPPRTWAAPAFGRASLCSPGSEAPGCQGSPSPARLCGGSCLCGFGVFPWLLTWSAPFHTFICWVRFRSCAAADGVLRPPPPWFPTRPRHRAPGAHISPLQGQLFAHGRKLMWLNLFIFPVG